MTAQQHQSSLLELNKPNWGGPAIKAVWCTERTDYNNACTSPNVPNVGEENSSSST